MTEDDTHMPDPPPYADAGDDTALGPERGSTTGMPRWVKISTVVVLVLVVLVVVLLLLGGHGPSRH